MRVLMIGPARNVQGGVSSVVNGYYDAGLDNLCDLTYLGTTCDGSKIRKLLFALVSYAKFIFIVGKYDVIHVHMASRRSYERKRLFILAALQRHRVVVVHVHGGEFDSYFSRECSQRKQRQIANLLARVDRVIVLSQYWRDYFAANVVSPDHIFVLPNAVVVPPITPDSFEHNVLFLGRLGPNKSPDTVLRAAQIVLREIPDAQFFFGGDGDISLYMKLAETLGVSHACKFLGWVSGTEKEALLNSCSVLCLPSRNEAMPISILEGMAHGLVVIATGVGAVPEVIDDNKNGFIIPIGDSDRLAKAIIELFQNPVYLATIAQTSYKTAFENFNVNKTIHTLVTLYHGLAAKLE